MMRRALPRAVLAVAAVALLACAGAYAITAEFGNTLVSATATLSPHALPSRGGAPVTLSSVTRIGTKDHSPPPILRKLVFMLDRHGSIAAKGLPVCTMAKLAETTPAQARKRCASALVGEGTGKAEVNMPGKAPSQISSPLSFFNAPPVGGRPSLIAHAYETVPSPKTLLVPLTVERISGGRYGYRVNVELPEIAGGFGAPTLAEAKIGRTFKHGGKRVGYLNAFCAGGRLQVRGTLSFANGDFFPATLTSACHTPG
jgi:hypothetical protein